jgi:isopentenyl-diphosphate delta-isomerase
MKEEKVILVDQQDRQIGTMEKIEAHEKAMLHRAFSIFIAGTLDEYLLQSPT